MWYPGIVVVLKVDAVVVPLALSNCSMLDLDFVVVTPRRSSGIANVVVVGVVDVVFGLDSGVDADVGCWC